MSDDPKTAGNKRSGKFRAVAAAVMGLAVIAVYVLYVILSSSGAAPVLLLLLQIVVVVSVVAGLAALFARRWICGLFAIVCPLLLPLCDLVVRMIRH
jgi:Kef-type K+ transport system membrane component KefB